MQIRMNEPVFRTQCRVLYGDTDAAGVVYNANYFRYFELGRTELMRAWVRPYRDIEKLGIIMPVAECFSRFKAPAHYDDLLTIETSIGDIKKFSCRFNYRITRQEHETQKPKLLVKGYTLHASVNLEGKLTAIPEEIITKLESLLEKETDKD
jgi:acyl-CoA thioester hydrolase